MTIKLNDDDKALIRLALDAAGGSQRKVSELLGVHPNTLARGLADFPMQTITVIYLRSTLPRVLVQLGSTAVMKTG
jgi:hypothetical protein